MNRARFRDQRVFHVDDPTGVAGGWYSEVHEGPIGAGFGPGCGQSMRKTSP